MADLKLNEELPFINLHDFKVKNIKGNIRLVGAGQSGSFNNPSSAWTRWNFNSSAVVYDDRYLSKNGTTNQLWTLRPGKYFFVWRQRAKDSITSQGCGVMTSLTEGLDGGTLAVWGGGVYRCTLNGLEFADLDAGACITVKCYTSSAVTGNSIDVWIFVVEGM